MSEVFRHLHHDFNTTNKHSIALTKPPIHQQSCLVNVEEPRLSAPGLLSPPQSPRPPLRHPLASTRLLPHLLLLLPQRPRPLPLPRAPVSSARWLPPLRTFPTLAFRKLLYSQRHLRHILTLRSGVAVGSSIGHAVGGWFSGGSSAPAEANPQSTEFQSQHQVNTSAQAQTGPCAENVTSFRRCMDENQGSLNICGWYLDQLKACQAAAGQY